MSVENTSEPTFTPRISRKVTFTWTALVCLIVGVSFSVIWYEGRPRLEALTLQNQMKLGQNISLALERELEQAKGVAMSIASAAAGIPTESRDAIIPKIVPPMLTPENAHNIYTGGGVWPEPYAFDPNKQRKSYFWAKNSEGVLEFLNDYNLPQSPGYHNEEWYVPVSLLGGQIYWSESYVDPYSGQPMVTCSAPIKRDGALLGVATVDLTLGGVSDALNQVITGLDAYAFIVDRNNRFIVFPTLGFDVSRTQTYSSNSAFQYLEDLVGAYPSFDSILNEIDLLNEGLYSDLLEQQPDLVPVVDRIVESSYQIDTPEAQRLVAGHWWEKKTADSYPRPLRTFELKNDLLLGGDVSGFVYQMPSTGWRIVTVFERSAFGAISDTISQKLFGSIVFSAVIFGILGLIYLKMSVGDRVAQLVTLIRESSTGEKAKPLDLSSTSDDEIGYLAYWVNYRTERLQDTIKTVKRASQAKTDFLTAMAHELKTPLNSILGFNRRLIIKLGSELDEANYKTLVGVQRSAHHLLSLVDDILEVSELDAGKVKLKFNWESVNMLLDDVSSQMTGQISDANLEFEIHPLKDDVRVFADRQKIIQVMMHLIANAVQATETGTITLKASQTQLAEHAAVCFSVTDTGKGLSNDEKHRIYRQFSQVDDHGGIEKGMGLGLYLIREITTLHSGAVFFESALGMGSSFSVLIPVSSNLSKMEDGLMELM